MGKRVLMRPVAMIFVLAGFFGAASVMAQKAPPDTTSLKLPGAKMAPVPFSHDVHRQLECVVCHHKEKHAGRPSACESCHEARALKDKAPPATDAFHQLCQSCHKQSKAKGLKAPTACNECHKK